MRSSAFMKYGRTGRRSLADTSISSTDAAHRQSIPGPSTFSGFFSQLLYFIVRKPLQINMQKRAIIYVVAIFCGSFFFDLLKPPKSYFSNNTNVLNVIFVKWAWGWTLFPLLFYTTLSSFVYCAGRKELIRAHIFRLLVATVSWYVCTNGFRVIEALFGQCSRPNLTSRNECLRNGRRWFGFDISGHTFLLILCNSCILEEVRFVDDWPRLGSIIESEDSPQLRTLSETDINRMRFAYKNYSILIKGIVLILSILTVLWDFMLLMTTIYFHTMPSKATAAVIGLSQWFLTYRAWYRFKDAYPGPPGKGVIKFTNL